MIPQHFFAMFHVEHLYYFCSFFIASVPSR